MPLLPVMPLLWEAGFHIWKHTDHKDWEVHPTHPPGVESIGYRSGEGGSCRWNWLKWESGKPRKQWQLSLISIWYSFRGNVPRADQSGWSLRSHYWFSNAFFFFLKKELLIIHNGLFSAGRLRSKLSCLLWQCPQGESRCPLPATHLHTPSIPTPSLARQWSRPPPPPLQPKKKKRR